MPGSSRRRKATAAPRAEVWLTDPAVEDLHRLDGSPLVWALKKMLLLETNPMAGEPLLGDLIGYRKLTFGDRGWRVVWRVASDDRGGVTVEIAEVWAVGSRADAEVYREMTERLTRLPDQPSRRALSGVVTELGRRAREIHPHTAPPPPAPRPEQWLIERLVHTAGLDPETVEAMTSEQAVDAWTDYISRPR